MNLPGPPQSSRVSREARTQEDAGRKLRMGTRGGGGPGGAGRQGVHRGIRAQTKTLKAGGWREQGERPSRGQGQLEGCWGSLVLARAQDRQEVAGDAVCGGGGWGLEERGGGAAPPPGTSGGPGQPHLTVAV